MNILENDIPKHKKKKKSTISKSKEKSKHKHEYTEKCIIKYPTPYLKYLNGKEFSVYVTTYCKHCGKVGDSVSTYTEDYVHDEFLNRPIKRRMTDEEILEYYKDLPIFEVDDMFVKYVPVSIN